MTSDDRHEALAKLRRRLWFLRERLKDVTHDPALTETVLGEKVAYYTTAIAQARVRLLEFAGH